jgi:drug/metabolite transporter (DMT)-like permease
MSVRVPAWAMFAALGTIWGSAYLAVKVGGDGMGTFQFVATRLAIALAVLAVVAVVRGERLPPRRLWPHVAVVALLGLVVPFTLITWGQRGVDAGLAAVFNAAAPIFTFALAGVALADEPLRAGRAVGIAVGFVGVVVVAGSGLAGGGSPASIVALTLGVLSYAATGVYLRRFLRGARPLGVALGQAGVGFVASAALALGVEGVPGIPATETVAALVWLGVVASAVAPLLFLRLIGTWGANRTALVNYLIPVVGVAAGVLLLGERLEVRTIAGGAIVLAGMAIAHRSPTIPWPRFRVKPAPAPIPATAALQA